MTCCLLVIQGLTDHPALHPSVHSLTKSHLRPLSTGVSAGTQENEAGLPWRLQAARGTHASTGMSDCRARRDAQVMRASHRGGTPSRCSLLWGGFAHLLLNPFAFGFISENLPPWWGQRLSPQWAWQPLREVLLGEEWGSPQAQPGRTPVTSPLQTQAKATLRSAARMPLVMGASSQWEGHQASAHPC